jgi:hypothetical protein
MKKLYIILLSAMLVTPLYSHAQITCSSFCVTSIVMDPAQTNTANITIYFAGTNNQFINYPYVAALTDGNNDTIGTGSMFFFGQIGGTSQVYSVTTSSALPPGFTGTVHFLYDQDTCLLSFPCVTGITHPSNEIENVLWNHHQNLLHINSSHTELNLFDAKGTLVFSGHKSSGEYFFTTLSPGVYTVVIHMNGRIISKKISVIEK